VTWRTGRKVGRTLYVQLGEAPADRDPLIGVMDTPELAAMAVRAVNAYHLPPKEIAMPKTPARPAETDPAPPTHPATDPPAVPQDPPPPSHPETDGPAPTTPETS
jgi:hypothetical protein